MKVKPLPPTFPGWDETADEYLKRVKVSRGIREMLEKNIALLGNIKQKLPALEKVLEGTKDHWGEEDSVYRYYHGSFKVYRIQSITKSIYSALESVSPHEDNKIRDPYYLQIVKEGASGREWKKEDNKNWEKVCRPMVEAFFHSKYFLEMAVKYGKKLDKVPLRMPSGWASLLELYGIR